MPETEVIDKDMGFKDLEKALEKYAVSKVLTVGIIADSPRQQFRLGTDQEFRPETAGLLLRGPVDAKKGDIVRKLKKIGREAVTKQIDPDQKLKELGEEIKFDMGRQTDPPPQLRNAIIVKVEDVT